VFVSEDENEDAPWRWVWVCLSRHGEFVLREEGTEITGSSFLLVWHQSHHRPAISSSREEGVVAREEHAVEDELASLEPQAGREGTVVWVEMMH
jgi:hypothetical protein